MTRDQGGLAYVGIAHQSDIGEKFQFQAEDALFAGASRFMLPRSLVSGGGEACISPSAAPAAGDDDAIVGVREVVHLLSGFVVVQDRAYRNFQQNVHALAAGAVGAFAVASALRFVFGIEAEVHQRVVAFAGLHDDVAALAAVAARGAAARNELLPAEGHAAVAAVAGFDPNFCLVDKHGQQSSAHSARQPSQPQLDEMCVSLKAERRADSLNKNAPARAEAWGRSVSRGDPALIFGTLLRFQRFDHDELAHRTFVQEFDAAADFGEEGVVLAAADVEAGFDPRAALAHDDGAARDDLSAKSLEAQPLRVGVASVS